MDITIYDGTTKWTSILPTACVNWTRALAGVGRAITLTYQRINAAGPDYRVAGGVVVSDSLPQVPGREAEGNYEARSGLWYQGFVHLFADPASDTTHALAITVHELGHCLMLPHPGDLGLVGFTDTVMTPYAVLTQPTAWDATNAMPGYPVANPPPDHKKRHKKKRKKKQH